ncbi:hypothetical protein [Neogemmobacter tilapiae]|uniref:Uncharacterized protein n=1 Tax=Neogemmobacter tilapiae TaxID=875041 RepID=A0A918TG58_9RHOB|nr:hypothetical protein [Gemmobacter tilapiae]GHC43638.1 hypothetical protein GCM10007315_00860 [Gemmobacter tilapiae]
MMNVQQNEFAARIQRIQNAQGSFRSTLYVGDDQKPMPGFSKRKAKEQAQQANSFLVMDEDRPQKSKATRLLLTPLALALGAATVVALRAVDFHVPGLTLTFGNAAQTMAVTLALATMFAILAGQAIGLTKPQHVLAAFVGVLGAMLGMHNLVHLAPDQFATIFSPAWVAQIQATMPANSVVVAGVVHPFG